MSVMSNSVLKLKNQIKSGEIVPSGNSSADIEINDNIIIVRFEEQISSDSSICVFLYDRKNESCIAFAETVIENDIIKIKFTDVTINAISKLDFKYARICVGIKSADDCKCCYIKGNEQAVTNNKKPEYSLGLLENTTDITENILVYYSTAGLLSVKAHGYDKEELFSSITNNLSIENISYSDESVVIKQTYAGNDYLYKSLDLVFMNNDDQMKFTVISSEYDSENNVTRITSVFKLENVNVYGKMKLSYSCLGNYKDVIVKNNYVFSGFDFNRNFKIESDNSEKTIIFNQNSGLLFMTVYRKYYNSVIAIIMAVYNTEQFLGEAIESVMNQKVDKIREIINNEEDVFYKNIFELILVDDGSTDNSGIICEQYADAYPQITVIHQENGGVSSARNAGINASNAKYLNFMDSDDKFSDNVFEECFTFFEKKYDEVTLVTFPLKFFDAATGDHWLNNKFSSKNTVVNMINNPETSTVFVNASLFKSEDIISNNHFFDTSLINGEDIKFIYLLYSYTKPVVGLVPNAVYWYRRRSAGEESAIQLSKKTPSFYKERLTNLFVFLKNYYIDKYGELPLYVQHLFMQQLQWLFIQDTDGAIAKSIISEEDYEEYKKIIFTLIQSIDAPVILKQKKLYREQKYFVCSLKEDGTYKEYSDTDVMYLCDGGEISKASAHYVRPEFIKINNGVLSIEGYSMSLEKTSKLYIKVNDEFYPVNVIKSHDKNVYSLGESIFYATNFYFQMELDLDTEVYVLEIYECIDGIYVKRSDLRYHKSLPLSNKYSESYFEREGWYCKAEKGKFVFRNSLYSIDSMSRCLKYEKRFIEQLEKSKEAKDDKMKKAISLRKNYIQYIKKLYEISTEKYG